MTTELQTTEQTTAQALIQILTLNKNTGTALEKLLKLPLLDADNKIPAGVLRIAGALSDGHIIESGDNANGYYVRFADGTQWCIISKDLIGVDCTNSYNSYHYYAELGIQTYPAEFFNRPSVLGFVTEPSSLAARGFITFGAETSDALLSQTPNIFWYRVASSMNINIHLDILAFGKWK